MKYFLITTFFLYSISASAFIEEKYMSEDEAKKLIASKAKDIDQMAHLLSIDLAPFVKTISRDVVTYNYRDKSLVGLPDLDKDYSIDEKAGLKYTEDWTSSVKKYLPKETGFLGWGFYTSNNPESSTDFAETKNGEFAMIKQKFPKGSTFLDIRHSGTFNMFPISNNTLREAKKVCNFLGNEGTGDASLSGYGRFQKNIIGKDPVCKEILIRAMEKLNISAILYPWREDYSTICDSGAESSAAFVSVNPKLSDETIELLLDPSEKLKKEALAVSAKPDTMKKFSLGEKTYYSYAKFAIHSNSYSTHVFSNQVEAFIPQDKNLQAKMINEIKDETFGCSAKYAKEDNELSFNPNNALSLSIKGFINKLHDEVIELPTADCNLSK